MPDGRPDRRSYALAVAGLVLAAAGGAWWWQSGTQVPATSEGPAAAHPVTVGAEPKGTPRPTVAPRTTGAPRTVAIPALGVDARVLAVRAPERTLVPPSDPTELGWWADGARPGARRGSALIAGHTVHTGGGALDDLERLRPGDAVTVRTDHGPIRYTVDRVRIYAKGRIAEDASRLFSQDVPGRLVLVTCEDWDGERYLSNVVVTASPRD